MNLAREKPIFDAIREGIWPFSENSIATAWDRDRFHRLVNVLRHEASHPLLLSAVKIGEKKFIDVVRLVERFVFRYITIVGAHPNPLYKPYYAHAKLMRDKSDSYQIKLLNSDTAMEPKKNNLGNLAIMAQSDNGATRNSTFPTKKIEFAKSSVNLTKRLAEFKSWTPKELAKREKELVEMALAVFKI